MQTETQKNKREQEKNKVGNKRYDKLRRQVVGRFGRRWKTVSKG